MNKSYRFLRSSDPEYPEKLKTLADCPTGLYIKGSLPDPSKKAVAIVGARSCSAYGRQSAAGFARVLAGHGVQIISGMALGIDACAHKGALEGGGKTFAVLGCGIDQCYPRSNYPLYRQILSSGGVLTEFEPGSPALSWHFPIRNRIISALSDAVIIIEARLKSGSLITASYALEQGIQIYAVPGKITDALSAGTNSLIWQGAIPALSPETVLMDLGLDGIKKEEPEAPHVMDSLSPSERRILMTLSSDPATLDCVCAGSGLSVPEASELLLRLELKGCVMQPVPGLYAAAYR